MNWYEQTALELKERIERLIPEHPEILAIDNSWELFKVPGFRCEDLQPSLFQASWALGAAKEEYKRRRVQ